MQWYVQHLFFRKRLSAWICAKKTAALRCRSIFANNLLLLNSDRYISIYDRHHWYESMYGCTSSYAILTCCFSIYLLDWYQSTEENCSCFWIYFEMVYPAFALPKMPSHKMPSPKMPSHENALPKILNKISSNPKCPRGNAHFAKCPHQMPSPKFHEFLVEGIFEEGIL